MENVGYGTIGGGASVQRLEPARPLAGIGTAADRIAKVNERLMEIYERFHGPSPQSAGNDTPPISIAYVNQVSRLHANIEQLENLVSSLADAA